MSKLETRSTLCKFPHAWKLGWITTWEIRALFFFLFFSPRIDALFLASSIALAPRSSSWDIAPADDLAVVLLEVGVEFEQRRTQASPCRAERRPK